jgi:hypothetical protein
MNKKTCDIALKKWNRLNLENWFQVHQKSFTWAETEVVTQGALKIRVIVRHSCVLPGNQMMLPTFWSVPTGHRNLSWPYMVTNQKTLLLEVSCYPMFTVKCWFRCTPQGIPRTTSAIAIPIVKLRDCKHNMCNFSSTVWQGFTRQLFESDFQCHL